MTRAEAIDILKNTTVQFGRTNGKTAYAGALQMAIKALEEPRKTGKWIHLDECSNAGYYCSKCRKKVVKDGWSETVKKIKFCPNCGAKMNGGT